MFGLWISLGEREIKLKLQWFTIQTRNGPRLCFRSKSRGLLEDSHLYAWSVREEMGPSPVIAR